MTFHLKVTKYSFRHFQKPNMIHTVITFILNGHFMIYGYLESYYGNYRMTLGPI